MKIAGRQFDLWRAVDSEGEVLDMLVQSRRHKAAALRFMRKLLKNQRMAPIELITDRLKSYESATRELGVGGEHIQASARTMGRKAPMCRSDCGSGGCRASARPARANAFSLPMLPSPTPSPPAVT